MNDFCFVFNTTKVVLTIIKTIKTIKKINFFLFINIIMLGNKIVNAKTIGNKITSIKGIGNKIIQKASKSTNVPFHGQMHQVLANNIGNSSINQYLPTGLNQKKISKKSHLEK